jgi:hypothetical protein
VREFIFTISKSVRSYEGVKKRYLQELHADPEYNLKINRQQFFALIQVVDQYHRLGRRCIEELKAHRCTDDHATEIETEHMIQEAMQSLLDTFDHTDPKNYHLLMGQILNYPHTSHGNVQTPKFDC